MNVPRTRRPQSRINVEDQFARNDTHKITLLFDDKQEGWPEQLQEVVLWPWIETNHPHWMPWPLPHTPIERHSFNLCGIHLKNDFVFTHKGSSQNKQLNNNYFEEKRLINLKLVLLQWITPLIYRAKIPSKRAKSRPNHNNG